MINLFVTTTSKAHALFCSILYIFAINIIKKWIYYNDTRAHDMKKWKTTINVNLSRNQFNSSFSHSSAHRRCVISLLSVQNLQSIRTRRLTKTRKLQIRKIWSNIRLRNQYRFVFVCSKNRSIFHTNIQMSFAVDRNQSSQQNSHSRNLRIYSLSSHFFFCLHIYVFTSIASVLKLSASTMICHDIYVSINEFLRNVDR